MRTILQMWVDSGLVGLGAFLFLFWVILRAGWQAYRLLPTEAEPLRSLALGGTLGVLGFLLGGLTQYNFGDAEVVIIFWAAAGLAMRAREWVEEGARDWGLGVRKGEDEKNQSLASNL